MARAWRPATTLRHYLRLTRAALKAAQAQQVREEAAAAGNPIELVGPRQAR